jgi:hypothetical protein
MRRTMLTAAALALLATPAFGQSNGLEPRDDQQNCQDWTRKLETGVEVIASTPTNNKQRAQAALQQAKSQQQASKWYACAVAADGGLRALDAG